jgi:hypothetical protein
LGTWRSDNSRRTTLTDVRSQELISSFLVTAAIQSLAATTDIERQHEAIAAAVK